MNGRVTVHWHGSSWLQAIYCFSSSGLCSKHLRTQQGNCSDELYSLALMKTGKAAAADTTLHGTTLATCCAVPGPKQADSKHNAGGSYHVRPHA